MLYLISGASASGKKTIARAVAERLPNLSGHHDGEKASLTGNNRVPNLERWVEDALALERDGIDLLLGTQSPLGEILASPQAIELAGIAPCLLDCHDFTRRRRLVGPWAWTLSVGRSFIACTLATRNGSNGSCTATGTTGPSGAVGGTGNTVTHAGKSSSTTTRTSSSRRRSRPWPRASSRRAPDAPRS